jgi:hypothetical protein
MFEAAACRRRSGLAEVASYELTPCRNVKLILAGGDSQGSSSVCLLLLIGLGSEFDDGGIRLT